MRFPVAADTRFPVAADTRLPLRCAPVSRSLPPAGTSAQAHQLAPRRGLVLWGRALIVGLALCLGAAVTVGACATGPGGAPRRNGMEAPPPFPVAPDFKLPDATGAERSLASLMGPKGLVLVLYRGHW